MQVDDLSSVNAGALATELARREDMWTAASAIAKSNGGLTAGEVNKLGIYRPQRGVWVDRSAPRIVANSHVAIGILHTGRHYSDVLDDSGIAYSYPETSQTTLDQTEVMALKNARRLRIPIFATLATSGALREVRRAWVVDFDDSSKLFEISFFEEALDTPAWSDSDGFELLEEKSTKKSFAKTRAGQPKFKFDVFARYGSMCAVCEVTLQKLLVAAHICDYKAKGTNDPRNGLPLCANHHAAFDAGFFAIQPKSHAIIVSKSLNGYEMGTLRESLSHLTNRPHDIALKWAIENKFERNKETKRKKKPAKLP